MSLFGKLKDMHVMRKQAREMQTLLSKEVLTGTSSNTYVSITIDGNQNVLKVDINENALRDRRELEKSVKEAVSRALESLRKLMVSKFSGMMRQ